MKTYYRGILLAFLLHPAHADDTGKGYWKDCPGPGCPAREEGKEAEAVKERKEELQESLDILEQKEEALRDEKKEIKEEMRNLEREGAGVGSSYR